MRLARRVGAPDLRTPGRRLRLGVPPPWWRGHRSRLARAALALILGLAAVVTVGRQSARAERILAAYGTTRRVPVAAHDLAVGQVLDLHDVTWRTLPPAGLPRDVLTTSPVGRTVVERVARGAVLGRLQVAPDGLSGLAARVPPGQRALAVPRHGTGLHLAVGDRVDVIDPGGPATGLDTAGDAAAVVARAVEVLAVGDTEVVVAVDDHDARSVAAALAHDTPVLALVGPG